MAHFDRNIKETESECAFKSILLKQGPLFNSLTGEDFRIQSLKSDTPHSEELFMVTTTVFDLNPDFNRMTRGAIWKFDGTDASLLYPSLGYAKEVISDTIELKDNEDGTKSVLVAGEELHSKHQFRMSICTEGFVVRMAVYKGVELLMTHSNINGLCFKWGSVRLSDIITRLGMPTHKELFGELEPEDITECVCFMLTSDGTVSGTRHDFTENGGYITFLGSSISGVSDYKKKIVEFKDIKVEDFDGKVIKEPLGVLNPILLNLEQANHMLKFGYYDSFDYNIAYQELLPGESVMLIIDDDQMVKVIPSSLNWRNNMRLGDPSIRNRFYHLSADRELGSNIFLLSFDKLSNVKELVREGPMVKADVKDYDGHKDYVRQLSTDHNERVRLFYFNLIFSLPPAEQRRHMGLYEEYVSSVNKLVDFIMAFYKNKLDFINPNTLPELGTINAKLEPLSGHIYHKGKDNIVYDITEPLKRNAGKYIVLLDRSHRRVDNILNQACKYTSSKIRGRISDTHYERMLVKNIRFLLSREQGSTIYQMVRQCDAWVLKETMIRG